MAENATSIGEADADEKQTKGEKDMPFNPENPIAIDANHPILGYSAKAEKILLPDEGKRLFGVELEVATTGDPAEAARKVYRIVKGDAILKHDGSISRYNRRTGQYWDGFEIVTRPMTLENQIKFWTKFMKEAPIDIQPYKAGSCGLHIHFTKKSIGALTLGKLLVFLNDPKNANFIRSRIARRYNSKWAKAKFVKLSKRYLKGDRYEMLNVTPRVTNEFRMFKATRSPRLLACLEFAAATIEFCEVTAIPNITLVEFAKFVESNKKQWPELVKRMKDIENTFNFKS